MDQKFDSKSKINLRIIEKPYAIFNCSIVGLIGSSFLFVFIQQYFKVVGYEHRPNLLSLIFIPIILISWWFCFVTLYRAFFTKNDAVIDEGGIHFSKVYSGKTIPWHEICDSSIVQQRAGLSLDILLTRKIYSFNSPAGSTTIHITHQDFNLREDTLTLIEQANEAIENHRRLAGW